MIADNRKIVLASASPRRKELINLICRNVIIRPADCDETVSEELTARETVEYLSKIKNQASRSVSAEDEIVISADTVVAIDGKILGKPENKAHAREMITLLSGKTHQVYTGVTISSAYGSVTFSEKTDVSFYPLSDSELEEYILSENIYDKAGAYAIQGEAAPFIKGINGDYYNVVGLPVARLNKELEAFLNNIENKK